MTHRFRNRLILGGVLVGVWSVVSISPLVLTGGWGFMVWSPLNQPLSDWVESFTTANDLLWVIACVTLVNGLLYSAIATILIHCLLSCFKGSGTNEKYQIHLSTLMLAVLIGGGMLWANLRTNDSLGQGWPMNCDGRTSAFVVDLAIGVAVPLFVAALSEVNIRKKLETKAGGIRRAGQHD